MENVMELDRAFAATMRRMVRTGQAPHHTELAAELGVPPDRGRELFEALIGAGVPGWLHPGTDYIASFPPFNNQPTQYRVTIDGHQQWFAQCGFEALAVRWLFPGKTVRIDAPCLDCGQPLIVETRDAELVTVVPDSMVGYTRSAIGGDTASRPFR